MNRTGLAIALLVAIAAGSVFAAYPRLDIVLAAPFFNSTTHMFEANAQDWVQHSRTAARVVVGLLVAPAGVALVAKLIVPRRRILIAARAAVFLVLTLAIGPGLITNTLLKDHWGRPRPIDIIQFGGTDHFVPWWDPRGECPNNCSFVAGEPSGAFWAFAPASFAPPQWRLAAYGAVLLFGLAVGVLRMAAGAHFFTDVVFAGVLMYLVVWIMHGLIYRWPRSVALWQSIGEAIRNRLVRSSHGDDASK